MPFVVPMSTAQTVFPEYTFVEALTPSEQKCAFHVRDAQGNELCLKIIAPNYSLDRLEREITALHTFLVKTFRRASDRPTSGPGKPPQISLPNFVTVSPSCSVTTSCIET